MTQPKVNKPKTNKWVVEQLELLLMDILLKSENPVKRYPLGQLKLRIGEFIDKLITQTQQEILDSLPKELKEDGFTGDYELGFNACLKTIKQRKDSLQIKKENNET